VLAQMLLACAERHPARHRLQVRARADEAVAVLRALFVDEAEAHAVALAQDVRARLGA
jgi:predicted nucleic acid-binding protein